VWLDLWRRFGLTDPLADNPIEQLESWLDAGGGVVLVVDDWDAAMDGRGAAVSDACYEVLDTLCRFCINQVFQRPAGPHLGILLLTSLPAAEDLEYFTRAVQRPTFERLSGLVTRSFAVERFPALVRTDAENILRDRGVAEEYVDAMARDCGGWLWLLEEAAAAAAAADGSWDAAVVDDFRFRRLPALIDEAVLRRVAERHEVRVQNREPMDYLIRELTRRRSPADFGLPTKWGDDSSLPGLLSGLLRRTFLVVDVENLRLPFTRRARAVPAEFPDGVNNYMQEHVGGWIARLAAEFDVADEDVWLVGKNLRRINTTVGDATVGQRFFVEALAEKEVVSGGSSDDLLAATKIVKQAEQHPFAQFVLVSEDGDLPAVLALLGTSRQVTVCTPWRASKVTRRSLDGWQIREHGLGVPRPIPVDDQERPRRPGSSWSR
jgi:hypothetical protein